MSCRIDHGSMNQMLVRDDRMRRIFNISSTVSDAAAVLDVQGLLSFLINTSHGFSNLEPKDQEKGTVALRETLVERHC